jgi:hypothetical protein
LIGKTDQDQTEAVAGQGSDDDQDQGITQPKAGIRVRKHGGMITPRGESGKRLKMATPWAIFMVQHAYDLDLPLSSF